MEHHPSFEVLDVESMIYEKRMDYYASIRQSQTSGDAAPFAEFMLARIHESLDALWNQCGGFSLRADDRLQSAREHFKNASFTRKDYLALFKTISAVTASRDLKSAADSGQLQRKGDKRLTTYTFREVSLRRTP
jgi:Fic family protein